MTVRKRMVNFGELGALLTGCAWNGGARAESWELGALTAGSGRGANLGGTDVHGD